jgi:tripartite-type tricarboxylate transporter receptor subunit TctC
LLEEESMRLSDEPSRLWVVLSLCASLTAGIASTASAADEAYPTRPIDLIVPWGPGGGADYIGRVLAKELQPLLGVSLPVLNVPGGTGQTGLIKMRDSKADGYTIEEVTSETVLLEVTGKPLFKPSDFVCLAIVDQQNAGLLIRADGPFKTWADIANAAKSRRINVAFDGYGSSGDLIINYLNRKLGAKFELVPYDKPGERIASVLGGHNDVLFTQPGDVVSYITGKQLRPILMFADERDPKFPDVPVSKEFGVAASLVHFRAMYVRAGTPPDTVRKLIDAVSKATVSPSYKSALDGEAASPNSVVSAEKAPEFIQTWLGQARRIKEAR